MLIINYLLFVINKNIDVGVFYDFIEQASFPFLKALTRMQDIYLLINVVKVLRYIRPYVLPKPGMQIFHKFLVLFLI